MKVTDEKHFSNGSVYLLETTDGFPVEVTDTFLPYYTKQCINNNNELIDENLCDRSERWMIGVSCMSGCPVGCKFCATGKLKKWRNLTANEIIEQVDFVLDRNKQEFSKAKEHKINYTRMGEPFLNIDNVKQAISVISERFPDTHHYISTIGVIGSDYSWIHGNITLQVSLHSLLEEKRNWLIPTRKMSIKELGEIRTKSNLKTTVNLTLVDQNDFDIELLKTYFNKDNFFIKLSPINKNDISDDNNISIGVINYKNRR